MGERGRVRRHRRVTEPALLCTAYLTGPGRERLADRFDLHVQPWLDERPPRLLAEEELAAAAAGVGASVVVVEADVVGAAFFERCPDVAVVAATRGDPWNLDVEAATAAGVLALRTPGRNARAVAELALGLMIAAARGIVAADRDIRADRWVVDDAIAQQRFRGPQIGGATLGLVGYGAVGRELARLARGCGMDVVAYDPYADAAALAAASVEHAASLAQMLPRCEYLSIHAALTDETRGLLGAEELALLPAGSVVVNTAREPILDRAGLIEALTSGHLGGAALDHFEGEYLAPDDPLALPANVVLTPHIGGASTGADACHTTMLADAFDALARGETPPGALNPDCAGAAARRLWP